MQPVESADQLDGLDDSAEEVSDSDSESDDDNARGLPKRPHPPTPQSATQSPTRAPVKKTIGTCVIGVRGILARHVGGVHTDSIVACGYVGACGTLLGCAIHGRVESAVVMYLVAGAKGTLGK
eukprot:COSAG05_NODE_824_length_7108_cov_616.375375_2_plen_123_part_00